jgi:hypothetical protein
LVFVLFNALIGSAFAIIGGNGLRGLWSLAMLLPGLGAAVRRLHDTARSAWWLFTCLIPPWLIVLLCLRGEEVANPYANESTGSMRSASVTESDLKPGVTYCPTCGKMRFPGQAYCASCGTKFPS